MNIDTAPAERAISLTDLMVMDKEFALAITDLEDVWTRFQYGSETLRDNNVQPTSAHRIEALHYDLNDYVQRLRSVAAAIVART